MSWKSTIAKKKTWKDSIMRIKPMTSDEIKADVLKLVLPEIKEKTSWKNTLSIVPKNGLDGKSGKDGKRGPKGEKGDQGPQGLAGKDGLNGVDGKNGIDGRDGSTWHLVSDMPEDIGVNGDFAFNKSNFEIYFKENDEWTRLGSIKSKDSVSYVGGLNGTNGLSAYEIAVRNGFVGTEVEWLESLGSAQVDLAQIVDEASATVTYIGKAQPGSAEGAALWQIKKITISGTETITTYADGDAEFDNIWDNRAGLSYS